MTNDDSTMFGRYELRGLLGQGGFAEVYRAWDTALHREVALKTLRRHLADDPSIRVRFLNEARAMARLHHPNIVTVHDVGEADGRPFFAMELVNGRSLAALAPTGGRMDLPQLNGLLAGVCAALDYLHAEGLVHRDIKPANIMVDGSGRAMLMDFGISRGLDEEQLTQTGLSIGTPEYMAPEQVRGQPAGPAADIYALGVLAYRMLAGRAPFSGNTAAVLHGHASEPPPPLDQIAPGLPASAYTAIAAALAKDPDDRPPSASAFLQQLSSDETTAGAAFIRPRFATQELDRTILAPSLPVIPTIGRRRSVLPFVALAVLLLLLGGGGAAVLFARGKQVSNSPAAATVAVATPTAALPSATTPAGSTPAASATPAIAPSSAPSPVQSATPTPQATSAATATRAPPTQSATSRPTAPTVPATVPPTVLPQPPVATSAGNGASVVVISKLHGAALRLSPSSDAPVQTVASCGTRLAVTAEQDGWFGVNSAGRTAWVGGARVVPAGTFIDCRGTVTFQVGQAASTQVASGCLSLRSEPSRDAGFTFCQPNGFRYTVTGGPMEVAGEDWLPVTSPTTGPGWVLAEFLLPAQ